ncbi:hypothetical protein VTK26DRAFT_7364 [Humicola hyalothermophila]
MPPRAGAPGADAVIRADEVLARVHGVVAVREAPNQPAVDVRPAAVPAAVVRAERVAEGARRRREERRRERARGALREQRDARVEAEGELRECRLAAAAAAAAGAAAAAAAIAVLAVVVCVQPSRTCAGWRRRSGPGVDASWLRGPVMSLLVGLEAPTPWSCCRLRRRDTESDAGADEDWRSSGRLP